MRDTKTDNFIKPQIFMKDGIHAFFTTNLLNHNLTDSVAKLTSISKKNIYLPVQKHTNKIHVLDSDLKSVVADAVLTEKRGLLIGVQVADCVPILLYDRDKKVIGAVHAGWRGTAAQILKNTIKTMQERFFSSSEDMLIAIGPSIRQCCYEVGDDVKTAVEVATRFREGDYYKKNGKWFIDLSSANKIQALSMGILQQNIWQSDECTFCNPDKFYSYRYTKNSLGRQGGFIGIF